MKSFIIQSLALIGAMVVIVDVASIPPPKTNVLLKSIFADANNMLNTFSQKNLTSRVKRPWKGDASRCWMYFFCLAEKSLNLTDFNQSKLTKHLHQYNKLTNITNCHLNMNNTISLKSLLTNITACTKIEL
ncbi:uncharacterized protein [Takifugu rubripes]|nr:uncharacterized protein LOC101070453 [Takifugu rubripes]|eukprot:XP_003970488.1 PREDICTED: uncharacterized protein LOC101070453 [Takifugu rubripes]